MNHILKTIPKAFPVTFSFDSISIVPISEKINSILYFFCDFVSFLQFTHCFFVKYAQFISYCIKKSPLVGLFRARAVSFMTNFISARCASLAERFLCNRTQFPITAQKSPASGLLRARAVSLTTNFILRKIHISVLHIIFHSHLENSHSHGKAYQQKCNNNGTFVILDDLFLPGRLPYIRYKHFYSQCN